MNTFAYDQAEGLRRLVAGPAPRVMTLLATDAHPERTMLLANIAASLIQAGRTVGLLETGNSLAQFDARLGLERQRHRDVGLVDVALAHCSLDEALLRSRHGFDFIALNRQIVKAPVVREDVALNASFHQLTKLRDIVIVAAELNSQHELPLSALDASEVMVQVSNNRASITNAYLLIKRLAARAGRRPFGIIITGATPLEARTIFDNMAQAASQYLALRLTDYGSIPKDESVGRAARLGRTVIDAFPLAHASIALRTMAAGLVQLTHPYSGR